MANRLGGRDVGELPVRCPCCWGRKLTQTDVLWPELIRAWQLRPYEVDYIGTQQGLVCGRCGSNLRTMTLAVAVMRGRQHLPLRVWLAMRPWVRILEINGAGALTQFLDRHLHHTLTSYPEVSMECLPFADRSFDLVIHSDTLEHVNHPIAGLRECHRVLKPGGRVCYTVPIVVDRLTRERRGLPPSYHGVEGAAEHLVVTEYGADAWRQLFEAGFGSLALYALGYPAGLALTGRRSR